MWQLLYRVDCAIKWYVILESGCLFTKDFFIKTVLFKCLLGAESLDQLQEYAITMFERVKNKNQNIKIFDPKPFSNDSLADISYVVIDSYLMFIINHLFL